MKTTIKEFKQISENLNQSSEYLIIVKNCYATLTKDSFNDGETDQVNSWDLTLDKSYKNVDDLISAISNNFSTEFNKNQAIIMDNRLILDATVDNDTNSLSEKEAMMWKNDEFEAFNLHVDCSIEVYETVSVSDSQEISKLLGIENYD